MADVVTPYASGVLVTGIAGAVLATVAGDATGALNFTSLGANLVQVGAPAMAGSLLTQLVFPLNPENSTGIVEAGDAKRALFGGTATAGVLIAAGALPAQFDMQLVSFILLASGAVFAGDFYIRNKYHKRT